MARMNIKPLSVNHAYRGVRYATKELAQYKQDLGWLLPRIEVPDGPLSVRYVFGVSSKASDGDNLIKCLQDVVAEHYGFNDKRIYHWDVTKVDVPKGGEFVEVEIESYPQRRVAI
ncbi:MAG: hypothetical protein AUJ19_00780 [Parcubacteria group bacterium CG1_02_58_44]|nr:MAG: hypothetical protein AUJ19_00780 [Parcubacteria group bacterium CG1_02_58_44]